MTIAVYQADGTALFNYKRPEITDNSAFAACVPGSEAVIIKNDPRIL